MPTRRLAQPEYVARFISQFLAVIAAIERGEGITTDACQENNWTMVLIAIFGSDWRLAAPWKPVCRSVDAKSIALKTRR